MIRQQTNVKEYWIKSRATGKHVLELQQQCIKKIATKVIELLSIMPKRLMMETRQIKKSKSFTRKLNLSFRSRKMKKRKIHKINKNRQNLQPILLKVSKELSLMIQKKKDQMQPKNKKRRKKLHHQLRLHKQQQQEFSLISTNSI